MNRFKYSQFLSTSMKWNENNKKIEKTFTFSNFVEALEFVNRVGELAEKHNHHPDILLHSYKKVSISLTTHSENKVTAKDYNLAEEIDQIN